MQTSAFVAKCPFKLGDKVKIILDHGKNVFSKELYIVDDIKAIHSLKNQIVIFKLVIKDSKGMEVEANAEDFKLVAYADGTEV